VTSSWFLFFNYHNVARSNKHQTYYYYLPLFQEILSVGASFAACVSSLDLDLCSTFSSSSRPNCSDSFCSNHAASSGCSSSGGEFITGELVTFFHYSYRKINYLCFLLTSNESSLLQLQVLRWHWFVWEWQIT